MKEAYLAEIIENRKAARDIYHLTVTAEEGVISAFVSGQFAHIKLPKMGESVLRRPISINAADAEGMTLSFYYAAVGRGTSALSTLKKGEKLDVLAPLGNGFSVTEDMKKIWLVGGGIGCAPLASVASAYSDREITAFLGFKSEEYIYGLEDFADCGEVVVTTDDGSFGEAGFVTEQVKKALEKGAPDVIFACGPHVFFKALKTALNGRNVKTYISMEQRMGCGTGGCAVCVCKVGGEYKKTCREGPVFDMREVEL